MTLFSYLVPVAWALVLGVLVVGIVGMLRGGAFNAKYGNLLMRWRLGLQALAILLMAVAFLLH